MGRNIRALVLGTVLLAAACQQTKPGPVPQPPVGVSGPQTYRVGVDGPSTPGTENLVFGTFFPATLKARPGDTIVFDNLSSHDIHTVTFGVKPDRSNQPRVETKAVQANPVVFGPCVTDTDPTPDWESCPGAPPLPSGQAPPPPPPYSGKGFWNSGVVFWQTAPAPGPKSVSVVLARNIAPEIYPFVCILHPFMNGQLDVVGKDAGRLSPAAVAAAGERQFRSAQAQAAGIKEPVRQLPGATAVAAGWGDNLTAVDRFAPVTVSVKLGDTVTWTDESPWMPHTITFQSSFKTPADPNAFLPAGAKSGSRYSGGVAHSGLIGPAPPFPTNSFSLRFARAGKYDYVCILHPGMAGVVEVK